MQKAKKKTTVGRPKLDLDTVYRRVLNALVRLQPKDLTYSKISRFTGVPRPTLYYYFGNRVESLVDESVRFGMKAFLQIYQIGEDADVSDWPTLQCRRMNRSLRLIRNFPWGPGLYFRYRTDAGAVGRTIREIEGQYLKEMAAIWKRLHGKAPDPELLVLSSAFKLGLFFALTVEGGLKIPESDESLDRWARELGGQMAGVMGLRLGK